MARGLLYAFYLALILDGVLTYIGVMRWGHGAEANPILLAMIGVFGLVPSLLFSRCVAMMAGMALYYAEAYIALFILNSLFWGLAVIPWVILLWWR